MIFVSRASGGEGEAGGWRARDPRWIKREWKRERGNQSVERCCSAAIYLDIRREWLIAINLSEGCWTSATLLPRLSITDVRSAVIVFRSREFAAEKLIIRSGGEVVWIVGQCEVFRKNRAISWHTYIYIYIYIYNARLSPFLDRLGSALYVKSRFHFWYYDDLPVSRFFPLFLRQQRRRQSRGKARIRVFGWNFNDFVSRLSERSDQWTEGLFLERAFRTRITANGSRNGERQDNQFCANEKPRERRCIKRIWQLVDWIHELLRFVHLVSILFSQFAWPARTLLVLRTSATEVRCDSFADK